MTRSTDRSSLQVSAIKDGTVLDHIPADKLFKVIEALDLERCSSQITFGYNLESKLLGRKAIIKIADRFFREDEINKIALIAPQAKINIIKDYEVVEKKQLRLPDEIHGIVRCANPMCVTNHQDITPKFSTFTDGDDILLRCQYCEKVTKARNAI